MELKETEKRLLEAVSKIIEEEGFTQIGINRIAKKAQCDKVLIYRYFGGLDGLLAAWAKQYDFYSFAYSEFAGQIAQVTTANLKDIIKEESHTSGKISATYKIPLGYYYLCMPDKKLLMVKEITKVNEFIKI